MIPEYTDVTLTHDDYLSPQAHKIILSVTRQEHKTTNPTVDSKPPYNGKRRRSNPPREGQDAQSSAATMKQIKDKEKMTEAKRRDATNNKENKEIKKVAKKDVREKEMYEKTIVDKITEQNREEISRLDDKISNLKTDINTTVRDEIRKSLKTIGPIIAEDVKDGLKEGMKNMEDDESPLATQKLIKEIEELNKRMNDKDTTIQPTGSSEQTNQTFRFNPTTQNKNKEEQKEDNKIPNIFPAITKDELIKTVISLIYKVNTLEVRLKEQRFFFFFFFFYEENQHKFLPSVNIDLDGNSDPQTVERLDNQPLDWTTVKTARRFRNERPELPGKVNKTMSKELKDHLKQQKERQPKSKPQEVMEDNAKEQRIKDMLNRQSLVIGAAPITSEHLESVEKTMIKRGVLNTNQPKDFRKQITIKSVIKSWAYRHLKITDEEWNTIKLDEIYQTYTDESNIIFMKCNSTQDAMKIMSQAWNLPHDTTGQGPCLIMYVDK